MEERIQKILARAGYGSRRSCEELILAGRVRVNGQVAELGAKADAQVDHITLDGKTISAAEELVYIALNKPRNVLSTVEAPDPRPTVIDLVPIKTSIYPVGRLDFESEGLILLTNDGDLANRLTHPRYGHQKEYRVLVARQPDTEQLETFRRGVVLEDGYRTAPAEVRLETLFGKGAWINVVLREGRKRQIREMCNRIGLPVVRIIRVRIGNLYLGSLKPREWRYLSPAEVQGLKDPKPATKKAPAKAARFSRHKPVSRSSAPGKGAPRQGSSQQGSSRKPKTGSRPSSQRRPGDKPTSSFKRDHKKPSRNQ